MHYAVYDAPVGRLLLESDGVSLTGLWFDRKCPGEPETDEVLKKAAAWLNAYFRGEDRTPDFPLDPKGTDFQKLVWRLLLEIPWGAARTYGDLARDAAKILGKKKMSAQAIGQALGANPIAIIIPCHRCVAAGGKLGGYAYGAERKKQLLALEHSYAEDLEETMTINEYQTLAMTTLNPELSKKDVLINGVMGLCGESGEAIDIVKKWLAQGHELDKEKLAKELGDIAWYLAETAYALELPLEDILQANIDKLKKRYPEGFDSQRSIHR